VPASGDQVVIASGHTVTYDVVEGSPNDVVLGTSGTSTDIDIRGALQFDTTATQPLRLQFQGFILIRSTGRFLVGTEEAPLPVRATIYKTTSGNMGVFRFENGATVSFVGSPNLPYDPALGHYRYLTTLASAASSGATQITVNHDLNWQVGDWIMMPRLWNEIEFSLQEPFVAQVTGVSGMTLTLSSGLPHAYPANAWVAKINRPITLMHNIGDLATHWFVPTASNNTLNITGFKWCWARKVNGRSQIFSQYANWQGSKIEYVTMSPSPIEPIAASFIQLYRGSRPIQIEHFIGRLMLHDIPVPITVSKGIITQIRCEFSSPAVIDGAHVWNVRTPEATHKVQFTNCILFSFAYDGASMFFDNCDFWGFVHWSPYTEPYRSGQVQPMLTSLTCKNCRFRNYSSLGYTSTVKNRLDWSARQHVYHNNYMDCEFYDTWVEPFSFFDPSLPHLSKVRFVNKKVGSTVIKEQEFQAGGVITSDEATLPPEGAFSYSLKFEPKNPNLPIVYDIPLPPKTRMFVYFRHDGSPSLRDALIAVVNLADQYVADPLSVAMESVDCLTYPANQWNFVVIENMGNTAKILRLMARGTAGAVWFMSLASPIFVAEPIAIDITEDWRWT
jgi:hypothetical protein